MDLGRSISRGDLRSSCQQLILLPLSLALLVQGIRGEQARRKSGSQTQVSYSRQIQPILALKCSGCHGPSAWWSVPFQSGFDVTSYRSLMKGAESEPEIVPGEPAQSPLIHFIQDSSGNIMPFGGKPLSPSEVRLFREWIRQGANEDHDASPSIRVTLRRIRVRQNGKADTNFPALRILCRMPVQGYATLIISDPSNQDKLDSLPIQDEPEGWT
jgi:Planctomycete cytochrome C